MGAFRVFETDWACDAIHLAAIRRAVFIDEQGVPESLEWDEHDAEAVHVLAVTEEGTAVGCARLLPDGHIGRMAVRAAWRGQGIGHALLLAVIESARMRGHTMVKLSAQTHAAEFYARAGFVTQGSVYEEAGIPHVAMQMALA